MAMTSAMAHETLGQVARLPGGIAGPDGRDPSRRKYSVLFRPLMHALRHLIFGMARTGAEDMAGRGGILGLLSGSASMGPAPWSLLPGACSLGPAPWGLVLGAFLSRLELIATCEVALLRGRAGCQIEPEY